MPLSIPVPSGRGISKVTLQDCISSFVREEILDKDDAWFVLFSDSLELRSRRSAGSVLAARRLARRQRSSPSPAFLPSSSFTSSASPSTVLSATRFVLRHPSLLLPSLRLHADRDAGPIPPLRPRPHELRPATAVRPSYATAFRSSEGTRVRLVRRHESLRQPQ